MSAQTGNLFGTVVDNQGQSLPGTTVTLTGASGPPRIQVTDAQGRFRFPELPPGQYYLKAELEGFGSFQRPNIMIYVGRNTEIEVTLSPAISQ
jgi:hypothetical protein